MSTSPPSYHHGELRAALVTAALELLAEAGADALSLRAVARRAGVSAMAPYRHYPDKEALLAAVAARGFERLHETLAAADAAAPTGALIAQAVAYVRFALDHPALFRLMFGPRTAAPHAELDAAGDTAFGVLSRRVATELNGTGDLEATVLGCWSLVHGLASLLLDGRVRGKVAIPEAELSRRVAAAMLAGPPLLRPA